MAWDVNDADSPAFGKIQPRKTQLNGYAAAPLLLKPVAINACEGGDEGGLAMINMACCAQNDVQGKLQRKDRGCKAGGDA